jgi:hypothetical protein
MTKIERELSHLDTLEVPPLEHEIHERVVAPADGDVALPTRSIGSRLLAGATALVVFAAVAAVAWRAFVPTTGDRVGTSPAADTWADYAEGWTALPEPPELRLGPSTVWTGDELIVWGGVAPDSDAPTSDAFAYDPIQRTWRELPDAPVEWIAASFDTRGIWTGTEALFYRAGVAFDPASETWRELPPSPHDPEFRQTAAVWTGSDVIVFGGGQVDSATTHEGAAYDPTTDRWRTIADAPIGLNLLSAAWTGEEVIVFGSLLDNRNVAQTETSIGAAYDPVADAWRMLPPSSLLSPQATSAVFAGGRLIAWDYEVRSQEYDPTTDTWSEPVEMPLEFSECYPDTVVAGDVVFAWFCGQAATMDLDIGSWQRLRGGVLEPTIEANDREYALFRFVSLAAAGDAVAMVAEGITVDDEGVPCYGCPGAPLSYWVYRPPA